jgi:hypothetical protein
MEFVKGFDAVEYIAPKTRTGNSRKGWMVTSFYFPQGRVFVPNNGEGYGAVARALNLSPEFARSLCRQSYAVHVSATQYKVLVGEYSMGTNSAEFVTQFGPVV